MNTTQHAIVPLYRVHTPANSKYLRTQLQDHFASLSSPDETDTKSNTQAHDDPPSTLIQPQYILSTITPSPSHIRQIQHLYDISLPIRYNPKFFDKLSKPENPLNRIFQSQTLILTSTPHPVLPFSNASKPSQEETSIQIDQTDQTDQTDQGEKSSNLEDQIPSDSTTGLAGTIQIPKVFQPDQKSEIHLHSSILYPLPYDIVALQTTNTVAAPVDTGYEVDQIEFDPLMLLEAKMYAEQFKQIGIPEFQQFEIDPVADGADNADKISTEPTDYIHSVTNPPMLNANETYHQVIGNWVVRPSSQTLTSIFSDLVYTANHSLTPIMSSISSWFSSASASPSAPSSTSPSSFLLAPQPMRSCYLCTIAVAPQFQSTGCGSLLLFNCIEFCIKNYNADYMYLHVLESNRSSIEFYKHFGFTIQGSQSQYFPLSQLHRTTTLSQQGSVYFEEKKQKELRERNDRLERQNKARLGSSLNGSFTAIILETDLDGIDETVNTKLYLNDDDQSASHSDDLDGVATDINGEPIKQTYLIAENETGTALSLCLDLDEWEEIYRPQILNWLKNKLNLRL